MLHQLLSITAAALIPPLLASAAYDPNRTEPPAPGWGPWQASSESEKTDYSAGFSNIELAAFLDFQTACAQSVGVPVDQLSYWFRLSHLIDQIGTGQVEYGCLVGGNITSSLTITAVKRSLEKVTCLQVNTMDGKGLPVYRKPRRTAPPIKLLPNSSKLNPGSFPALVITAEDQNWVAISSPVKGWVIQGSPGSRGNLRLCSSPIKFINH
ncbi:MAG: hypothetical protein K6T90_14135 [Leptolyngbyaceae cyanobacterium HOT.MB2.61]|jgi:hypothetical protein|nr:hypothetical protein [Leptolyngbyaceae cyanobacterium HOT.MB2.61]